VMRIVRLVLLAVGGPVLRVSKVLVVRVTVRVVAVRIVSSVPVEPWRSVTGRSAVV
jgi:hypothetical protein